MRTLGPHLFDRSLELECVHFAMESVLVLVLFGVVARDTERNHQHDCQREALPQRLGISINHRMHTPRRSACGALCFEPAIVRALEYFRGLRRDDGGYLRTNARANPRLS
jgi:hypothetical protein